MATEKQVDYLTGMINELGYDEADYDFDNMTTSEVSKLITELKEELHG